MKTKKCIVCGRSFEAKDGRQKICSEECKGKRKAKSTEKKQKPAGLTISEKIKIAKDHGMEYADMDAELFMMGLKWKDWPRLFKEREKEQPKRVKEKMEAEEKKRQQEEQMKEIRQQDPEENIVQETEDPGQQETPESIGPEIVEAAGEQEYRAPREVYNAVLERISKLNGCREGFLERITQLSSEINAAQSQINEIENELEALMEYKDRAIFE